MMKSDELDRAFERAIDSLEALDAGPCRDDWQSIRRICDQLSCDDQENLLFAVIGLLARQRHHFEGAFERQTDSATQARKDTQRLEIVLRYAKQFASSKPTTKRSANYVASNIVGPVNDELEQRGLDRFSKETLRRYLNDHRGWGDKIEDILDPRRPRRRRHQSESEGGR